MTPQTWQVGDRVRLAPDVKLANRPGTAWPTGTVTDVFAGLVRLRFDEPCNGIDHCTILRTELLPA